MGMLSNGLSITVRFNATGVSSVETRNRLIRTGISARAERRRFGCSAISMHFLCKIANEFFILIMHSSINDQ